MATLSWKNMQSSRPRSAVRAMSASSRKSRSLSQIASGWRQPVGWHPGRLKNAPKRNCRLAAVIRPPPWSWRNGMQGACHRRPRFATPDGLPDRPGCCSIRNMPQPLLRRARDCRVSRISPADTNKFVMTVDPVVDKTPFLSVIEIFETGGKTPLHHHDHAHEMFYVLSGRGRAHCDGRIYDLEK